MLQSESSPQLTPPPPFATPLGWSDSTQCGFMASQPLRWRCMNSDPDTRTFLSSPPPPSLSSKGTGRTSRTTETSRLSGSHFATVCLHTHTHLSAKWGRESGRRRARVRGREGVMFACVCVGGWVMQRWKTSSYDIYLSINTQKSLSTWVRPHPALFPLPKQ